MGFLNDKDKGVHGEDLVLEVLKSFGLTAGLNPHTSRIKLAEYDIEVDNPAFTIEVKNDLYATRSGNIAIEFYNPKSGTESGLYNTKADVWAHIVNNEVYFISVSDLLDYISANKPFKTIDCGGDDNASLFLYKTDILDEVFVNMTRLDRKKALKT